MEKSAELSDIVLRVLEGYVSGDISTSENITSQKDEVLLIGSDPNEWWEGYNKIISTLKSQSGELSGATLSEVDTKAYVEGTTGWFNNRTTMKMPDDLEIPFRVTGVFHQEDGDWKIIQWHASVGVANEEAMGQEFTT
ncbi:MAG: nuclear transport factor 2 family protein [Chloroflexi bacterium]|nr:nuclear transport factor 2 family protein [Chloroflexota bacterium]